MTTGLMSVFLVIGAIIVAIMVAGLIVASGD